MRVNDAVVERLEKVIDTLQDNSIKMGQMLAVHDEKLDKQDRIDAVLFEKVEHIHKDLHQHAASIREDYSRDFKLVDDRLRIIEKKMWTIAGAIAVISVVVSPLGQKVIGSLLTPDQSPAIIQKTK